MGVFIYARTHSGVPSSGKSDANTQTTPVNRFQSAALRRSNNSGVVDQAPIFSDQSFRRQTSLGVLGQTSKFKNLARIDKAATMPSST
jgi:hypothetical protein